MGGAVGPEEARLRQGPGIPPVGLNLARPGRIHRRAVRVRHDDLVAERSRQRATHSLSVEASITIRARGRVPRTAAKRSGSVRMRRSMTSPLSAKMYLSGVDRDGLLWGSVCHHVKREARRFIRLRARWCIRLNPGGNDGNLRRLFEVTSSFHQAAGGSIAHQVMCSWKCVAGGDSRDNTRFCRRARRVARPGATASGGSWAAGGRRSVRGSHRRGSVCGGGPAIEIYRHRSEDRRQRVQARWASVWQQGRFGSVGQRARTR